MISYDKRSICWDNQVDMWVKCLHWYCLKFFDKLREVNLCVLCRSEFIKSRILDEFMNSTLCKQIKRKNNYYFKESDILTNAGIK